MNQVINNQLQMSALEATADGVLITDCSGYILWVNPAYSMMTGYSLNEVEGRHTRILKSGKQNHHFYNTLWSTVLSGNVWHGELWNKRKDGSEYLEEQSITPVLNDQGEVSHFVAIKRDITQRFEWQQQLAKAQKMEAVGQLTAGIAHNFNNKLALIIGFTDLLQEETAKYKDVVLDDYIEEIKVASKAARDLVKQLISFSQEDRLDSKPLYLDRLIQESLKPLSLKLPAEITLDVKIAPNLPPVNHNQVKIYQMLTTLVVNARDAIKSKGRITIGLCYIHINEGVCTSCHGSLSGDFIQLSVTDTGHGIASDDVDEIFLPFFSSKEMSGGIVGMGLSVLHGILHDHGGHVFVKTKKGAGTIFNLLFPVSRCANDTGQVGGVQVEE